MTKAKHITKNWQAVIPLFLIYLVFFPLRELDKIRAVSHSSLSASIVGMELMTYVKNNNGKFPKAERWCDELLQAGNGDTSFDKYSEDFDRRRFRFFLNRHVYESENLPNDMVVLFSAIDGWNKVGDMETLKDYDYTVVFFAGGKTGFFTQNQLQHLKWKKSDSGQFPFPKFGLYYMISAGLFIGLAGTYLAMNYKILLQFWFLALLAAIAGTGVGWFIGSRGAWALTPGTFDNELWPKWTGYLIGALVGLIYASELGRIHSKYKAEIPMFSISLGMGMFFSFMIGALTNIFIMIPYRNFNFLYLFDIGKYATFTGIFIGIICYAIISVRKVRPLGDNPAVKQVR